VPECNVLQYVSFFYSEEPKEGFSTFSRRGDPHQGDQKRWFPWLSASDGLPLVGWVKESSGVEKGMHGQAGEVLVPVARREGHAGHYPSAPLGRDRLPLEGRSCLAKAVRGHHLKCFGARGYQHIPGSTAVMGGRSASSLKDEGRKKTPREP